MTGWCQMSDVDHDWPVNPPGVHTRPLPPRCRCPDPCRRSWRTLCPAQCQTWGSGPQVRWTRPSSRAPLRSHHFPLYLWRRRARPPRPWARVRCSPPSPRPRSRSPWRSPSAPPGSPCWTSPGAPGGSLGGPGSGSDPRWSAGRCWAPACCWHTPACPPPAAAPRSPTPTDSSGWTSGGWAPGSPWRGTRWGRWLLAGLRSGCWHCGPSRSHRQACRHLRLCPSLDSVLRRMWSPGAVLYWSHPADPCPVTSETLTGDREEGDGHAPLPPGGAGAVHWLPATLACSDAVRRRRELWPYVLNLFCTQNIPTKCLQLGGGCAPPPCCHLTAAVLHTAVQVEPVVVGSLTYGRVSSTLHNVPSPIKTCDRFRRQIPGLTADRPGRINPSRDTSRDGQVRRCHPLCALIDPGSGCCKRGRCSGWNPESPPWSVTSASLHCSSNSPHGAVSIPADECCPVQDGHGRLSDYAHCATVSLRSEEASHSLSASLCSCTAHADADVLVTENHLAEVWWEWDSSQPTPLAATHRPVQ